MVSQVLVEEVMAVDDVSEAGRDEIGHWYYHVPCAGVKYYSFEQKPSSDEQVDPWSLDFLTAGL